MKKFSDSQLEIETMPFYCGGSFTFETEDISNFKAMREQDGADLSDEQRDKLYIDMDVDDTCSITPVRTDTSIKMVKIDIMEMLKEQAGTSHDKALMDAYDFLSQYLKAHSHFIILGAKFTLTNLLKEMKMKPRIPSTILNQIENVVLSYLTLDDFPHLDIHEGSQPMICLCVQGKRKIEDILRSISVYLDCIQNVPFNKICLMIFGDDVQNEFRSTKLKRQVQDIFGISKSFEFGCGTLLDLSTSLLKVQAEQEPTVEYRSYADYKVGKVIIKQIKFHL